MMSHSTIISNVITSAFKLLSLTRGKRYYDPEMDKEINRTTVNCYTYVDHGLRLVCNDRKTFEDITVYTVTLAGAIEKYVDEFGLYFIPQYGILDLDTGEIVNKKQIKKYYVKSKYGSITCSQWIPFAAHLLYLPVVEHKYLPLKLLPLKPCFERRCRQCFNYVTWSRKNHIFVAKKRTIRYIIYVSHMLDGSDTTCPQ